MSKKIKLDETSLERMVKDFIDKAKSMMCLGGKIDISHNMPADDKTATLLITPLAYTKMHMLIQSFTTEVAWHGLVDKTDESTWVVYDILVYPHEVGGATVTADYEKYSKWLEEIDDETFAAMKFHGHSHVNMGVTPSSVDNTFRQSVVKQIIGRGGFYIFLIGNKRGDVSAEIYDVTNNALYSTSDKSLSVSVMLDNEYLVENFIQHAKNMATERPKFKETPYTQNKSGKNNKDDLPWDKNYCSPYGYNNYPYGEIFGD